MKMNAKIKIIFSCLFLMLFMNLPVQASELTESKYTISNKREFLEFAEKCRLDKFSENLVVVLEADIDLSGNEFDGIPIFCGMFEGNHHTISGLNIVGNGSAKGLFRYLTEEALVQNLSVKGKVTPQGSKSVVGGLIGENAGTVLNCSFSGEVDGKDYVGGLIGINMVTGTIENCQTEGEVLGIHFVGGIVGENSGVIRDCTNDTKVNTKAQKSNLEVSDITIESLTNSEATYTITDVGGIAGSSSGVIKNSKNQGTIGYQHIGYNIGGIVGSQVGYVFACENLGEVLGRKEVGGIVGQMEPVANLEFSADTLQILEGQLGRVAVGIQNSSDNMQAQINESTSNVNNQIGKLQNELSNTDSAVTQLLKDIDLSPLDNINQKIEEYEKKEAEKDDQWSEEQIKKLIEENQLSEEEIKKLIEENRLSEEQIKKYIEKNQLSEDLIKILWEGSKTVEEAKEWYELIKQWRNIKLPDEDSVLAAKNSLNKSMSAMNETLNSITQNGQSSLDTLTGEMQEIVNQAKRITSTVAHASDNIGISITDVSDNDTEDNFIAKIESCKNMGAVHADLNGGGIIGAIALENDLDPEGELEISGDTSLNLAGELRAVVLNCENGTQVTVRNQNAGGIAGWVFLGLVKNCVNTGSIEAENADYIGGIAGISTGYIRNNSAKCEISGNTYIGGIVGSGSIVSECRSMVRLKSGNEKIGSIMGNILENFRNEEEPVNNNFYLTIEKDFGGIDGISYSGVAEPLERDEFLKLENLPKEFWKVKVTFKKEDNTFEQVLINHGGALELADIPQVPYKEGYFGFWDGLEETDIGNILFDLSFDAGYTPVKGTIPSKKKGKDDKPILLLQGNFKETQEIALIETDSKPNGEIDEEFLSIFGFTLAEGETATGARYLIGENVKGENLKVFVRSPEVTWYETQAVVDGSYLVFSLKNGENQIAISESHTESSMWGALVVIVAVFIIMIIVIRVKKKKHTRNEN